MNRMIKTVLFLSVLFMIAQVPAVTADDPFYSISIEKSMQDGKNAATVTVIGRSGYHTNLAYPWKLTVKPAAGVVLDKEVYTRQDAAQFDENKVVFVVSYTGQPAEKMSAELKLNLCNDAECRSAKVPLSW